MVKNISVNDLALIELVRDQATTAPLEVLKQLKAGGLIRLSLSGVPTLTLAGKKRGTALQGAEQSIRQIHARAGGGCAIKAIAGGALRG